MARKKYDREMMRKDLRERRKMGEERKLGGGGFKTFLVCPEDVSIYKPDTSGDDHEIDILPYQAGKRDPLRKEGEWTRCLDIFVHNNVGSSNDQFVCPAQEFYNEKCPVCEERTRLYSDGEKDKADRLWPSRRIVYNILCYDSKKEEEKGVQIFPVAYTYLEEGIKKLEAKAKRRADKDIDPNISVEDPDEGRTISFNVSSKTVPIHGKPVPVPDYDGIELMPRDYKISDEDLDDCYALDKFLYLGKENEDEDDIDWKAFYNEINESFTGDDGEEKKSDEDEVKAEKEEGRRSGRRDRNKKEEKKDEKDTEDINKKSCPGEFGTKDVGSFDECERCSDFPDCASEKRKQEKEDKKEDKKEGRERSGRSGRRSRIE